jgi:hypothetical protein
LTLDRSQLTYIHFHFSCDLRQAHLARQIADGLAHAAEQFPRPPVPATALQAQLDDYKEKDAAVTPVHVSPRTFEAH